MNARMFLFSIIFASALAAAGPEKTTDKKPYLYKNKPRSRTWLNFMYGKFRRHLVQANGRIINLGVLKDGKFPALQLPDSKDCGLYVAPGGFSVVEVIDEDEILAQMPTIHLYRYSNDGRRSRAGRRPGRIFHLKGIKTEGLIDRKHLRGFSSMDLTTPKLLSAGVYRDGARSLPSFTVCTPRHLTKEEFAKALAEGLELTEYKWVKKRRRAPKSHRKKWIYYMELTSRPIK